MSIVGIDHINIDTCDLDATINFYEQVMGLEARRKPSGNPGVWLYQADQAFVHVNPVDVDPGPSTGLFHHVAFAGSSLEDIEKQLISASADYELVRKPDRGLAQFNLHDPNGILIEITVPFPSAPAA